MVRNAYDVVMCSRLLAPLANKGSERANSKSVVENKRQETGLQYPLLNARAVTAYTISMPVQFMTFALEGRQPIYIIHTTGALCS